VFGQAFVYLGKYLIFFQISELALKNQPKNSIQLPKPTADTHKIQNKLTTVGSGEKKNLQIKTFLFVT